MKLATIVVLMGIPLLGSLAPLNAADQAGVSQTVISFLGGSVWNADYSGGTCVWYFPLVGSLDMGSLFSDTKNPTMGTSDLIWVSEFTVQMLPAAPPFLPVPASSSQAPPYAVAHGHHLFPVGSLQADLAGSHGVVSDHAGGAEEHELRYPRGHVHQKCFDRAKPGWIGFRHFHIHGRPVVQPTLRPAQRATVRFRRNDPTWNDLLRV